MSSIRRVNDYGQVRYIAEVVLQMARELLPEAERGKVASYRKVLFR